MEDPGPGSATVPSPAAHSAKLREPHVKALLDSIDGIPLAGAECCGLGNTQNTQSTPNSPDAVWWHVSHQTFATLFAPPRYEAPAAALAVTSEMIANETTWSPTSRANTKAATMARPPRPASMPTSPRCLHSRELKQHSAASALARQRACVAARVPTMMRLGRIVDNHL